MLPELPPAQSAESEGLVEQSGTYGYRQCACFQATHGCYPAESGDRAMALPDAKIVATNVLRERPVRLIVLIAAIVGVSLLHYHTPTTHIWLHPILQRAYYIPLLLMALWFGWRGGVIAAVLAGLLYIPVREPLVHGS